MWHGGGRRSPGCARARDPIPALHPCSWVEHDPAEILRTVDLCAGGALAAAKAAGTPARVIGVGVANQRETTVAWDGATGEPLCRAIVWNDARTSAVCAAVEAAHGGKDAFRRATGLPVSPYFSCYKMRWMLDNVDAVRAAAAAGTLRFGTVDAWLAWRLTGGPAGGAAVTDATNASRTGLLDIESLQWHAGTCAAMGIDPSWLPTVASSAEPYGVIAAGPLAGSPLTGILGDQQAALLGQRCRPGDAKATFGTGAFVLLVTGAAPTPSTHGLLTTVAYKLGPTVPAVYALEGAVAVAGAGVTWLVDGLGVLDSPAAIGAVAESVPSSGGAILVPAFGGLLAPRWRPDARGALLGVTAGTTRAHVCRAMLDAIAWQTREVTDAMGEDAAATGAPGLASLRVDGGASACDLLMRLQADALGVAVVRPPHGETTSLGAALAAGVGAGAWSGDDAFRVGAGAKPTLFHRTADASAIAARYAKWRLAVERTYGLAALTDE